MAITGVMRSGYVQIRVGDIKKASHHYADVLGLIKTAEGRDGRLYFKCWDEHDHHCLVLRPADAPGLDWMGFKVADAATLAALGKKLEAAGIKLVRLKADDDLGVGERLRFVAPTGHSFELYAEMATVGNGMSTVNPEAWPDGLVGMHPSRLDHCLLYGDDLDGTVKIFTEILGLSITERIMTGDHSVMIGAFLSCGNKAHDVAFIRAPEKGRFHHASFYLESWEEVLRAGDLISKHRVKLDIGPTRHGITRGATIYFFDPAGNRNEVFSGGYIYYPDRPTLTWTDDELGRAIFYHDRQLNEAFLSVTT